MSFLILISFDKLSKEMRAQVGCFLLMLLYRVHSDFNVKEVQTTHSV